MEGFPSCSGQLQIAYYMMKLMSFPLSPKELVKSDSKLERAS